MPPKPDGVDLERHLDQQLAAWLAAAVPQRAGRLRR
jgi:hypothetical protein